jgi:hypothetical protein
MISESRDNMTEDLNPFRKVLESNLRNFKHFKSMFYSSTQFSSYQAHGYDIRLRSSSYKTLMQAVSLGSQLCERQELLERAVK